MSDDPSNHSGDSSDDDPYTNKWFSGMKAGTARKTLIRWTEEKRPMDKKFCGQMYGHFFNWKISNVDRRTKRGGEESFYDSFKKHGWFRLKYIFRPTILEVMRQEIINSNLDWQVLPSGNNQVYSVMSKSRLCEEELGCEFLHHFFKVVTAGSFPNKNAVCELTLLKTEIGHNHEWVDCDYHTDLTDAPETYVDKEESPISLFFSLENQSLELDLIPKTPKTGRKPIPRIIKLGSGDVLLFDTCQTKHRTARPRTGAPCPPFRVNVCMTGIEDYMDIDAVSTT
jgi:hypothetical protein